MTRPPKVVQVHDPCRARPGECWRLHAAAALLAAANLPQAPQQVFARRMMLPHVDGHEIQVSFAAAVANMPRPAAA